MIRYFISKPGADLTAFSTALVKATQHAKESGCGVLVLVASNQVAKSTFLSSVFGVKRVQKMLKGGVDSFDGVELRLSSWQALNPNTESDVLISLWGHRKMLEKIDQCEDAAAVFALSWLEGGMDDWVQNHEAKIIEI